MAIRGIVFDKDGTLFDFTATWSAWAMTFLGELAAGDPDRAALLGLAIGFDTRAVRFVPDSPVIGGTPGELAEILLPLIPGTTASALVGRMNATSATAPMVEAAPLAPLLADLRARGLKLGVATNDGEVPARAHLRAAGVEDSFDFIAGFDSGHGSKPGPGQLRAFAEAAGLDPAEVVMVGDSAHDLHAARAAGMRGVAVLTGIAEAPALSMLAEVVLPSIAHLPAWLEAEALAVA